MLGSKEEKKTYKRNQAFLKRFPSECHLLPIPFRHHYIQKKALHELHNPHSWMKNRLVRFPSTRSTNERRLYLFTIKVPVSIQQENEEPFRDNWTYILVQSSTGGVEVSFHTASQAKSRSNPVMFFETASAIRESAWVPTFHIFKEKVKTNWFFFSGEERTIVRTMILVSTIFFHIGNQPPYIRITKKEGRYEGSILCDASNLDVWTMTFTYLFVIR